MKRTERLFAIAEMLRAHRTGITAEQIAERFDVAPRTIYRDLLALQNASLPVHAERGRGGGFALDRAYTLPPVNFSAREAAVLLAAARFMTELRVLPFTDTLAAATDKVRAALSVSGQRELLARLQTLQMTGVPQLPTKLEVRRAVEQAFFEQQPLCIRYRGASAPSIRRVRIERVVMERSETL
jgi:predicted DNA-binding transcriptional regulator YafY